MVETWCQKFEKISASHKCKHFKILSISTLEIFLGQMLFHRDDVESIEHDKLLVPNTCLGLNVTRMRDDKLRDNYIQTGNHLTALLSTRTSRRLFS